MDWADLRNLGVDLPELGQINTNPAVDLVIWDGSRATLLLIHPNLGRSTAKLCRISC